MIGVANHLGDRVRIPGHDANGVVIGDHCNVTIGVCNGFGIQHKFTGDSLNEKTFWNTQAAVFQAFQKLV